MPPLFPLLHHHFDFLHRLHPRQWHKLGPRPPSPFHPSVPHVLDPRGWLKVPIRLPPVPRIHTRQFRIPIDSTTILPTEGGWKFPPSNIPQDRYHPAIEFVLNLLRWIFHLLHAEPEKPKPPPDYRDAEEVVIKIWKCVVFTIVALILFVLLLLLVIRVCVAYDRHQSKHGQVGVEMARRDDAMILACEKKGRKVKERMERERIERIWAEESKRQAVRDEYLRRQSILQGKLPVLSMMREESVRLGKATIEGVGEGPPPRPSPERSTSKREARRGHGTQMLSEEDDILRRSASTRVPRGAEGRIGNSVWRSNSYKSIQRRDSEPQVFMRNRALGLMGVKRNPSFKSSIQDRLDGLFNANSAENPSATTALLGKHMPLERALSFSTGNEFLHVAGGTSIHTWSFRNANERRHLHDKNLKNELVEAQGADSRHVEDALQAKVEGGDRLPEPSLRAEYRQLEQERFNGGGVHGMATIASIATSGASYHSAETASLFCAASHAAPFDDDSTSSHHSLSDEPQPDHPLLGAHIRSTSTILHTPSPTIHPTIAQSNVERLEEGVRSRSSIDNPHDADSARRARDSIATLHGRLDEVIMSRAMASANTLYSEGQGAARPRGSVDTVDEAMVSLPRAMALANAPQGGLDEVVRLRSGGSGERNERSEMVLLPRLSFETSGGWSPIETSDVSDGKVEDRTGRPEWEVERDGKDGWGLRRVSTCTPQ